jgi:phosphatidate cytidylyltransferase
MSNLARRVIVAVVGIPLAFLFLYAGELALALFLGALAAVAAHELYQLASMRDVRPLAGIGITVAAALPLGTHLARLGIIGRPFATLTVLLVALAGVAVWGRRPDERPLESIAVTAFGVLYCGGTLSFAYSLRHHPWAVGAAAGSALVMYPLVITWGTDTAGFFVGRWIGRRKLAPTVSPGKTVAGAVAGLIVAMGVGIAYNSGVLRPAAQLALAPWTAAVFGLVVAIAAQAGDLAESLFKREAGVKDSSTLLPGHGGMLDRLDSLFFVFPVAYLVLGRFLLPAPR